MSLTRVDTSVTPHRHLYVLKDAIFIPPKKVHLTNKNHIIGCDHIDVTIDLSFPGKDAMVSIDISLPYSSHLSSNPPRHLLVIYVYIPIYIKQAEGQFMTELYG